MNYKIQPTESPGIFTLLDESGNPIADVRGKALAERFAALPELLQILDGFIIGYPGTWQDAWDL